jgi:hypothetical protein
MNFAHRHNIRLNTLNLTHSVNMPHDDPGGEDLGGG